MRKLTLALGLTTCLINENVAYAAGGMVRYDETPERTGVHLRSLAGPFSQKLRDLLPILDKGLKPSPFARHSLKDLLPVLEPVKAILPFSPPPPLSPSMPVVAPTPAARTNHVSPKDLLTVLRQSSTYTLKDLLGIVSRQFSSRPAGRSSGISKSVSSSPVVEIVCSLPTSVRESSAPSSVKDSPGVMSEPTSSQSLRQSSGPSKSEPSSSVVKTGSSTLKSVPDSFASTPKPAPESSADSLPPVKSDWEREFNSVKVTGRTTFETQGKELRRKWKKLTEAGNQKTKPAQELAQEWERLEKERSDFLGIVNVHQTVVKEAVASLRSDVRALSLAQPQGTMGVAGAGALVSSASGPNSVQSHPLSSSVHSSDPTSRTKSFAADSGTGLNSAGDTRLLAIMRSPVSSREAAPVRGRTPSRVGAPQGTPRQAPSHALLQAAGPVVHSLQVGNSQHGQSARSSIPETNVVLPEMTGALASATGFAPREGFSTPKKQTPARSRLLGATSMRSPQQAVVPVPPSHGQGLASTPAEAQAGAEYEVETVQATSTGFRIVLSPSRVKSAPRTRVTGGRAPKSVQRTLLFGPQQNGSGSQVRTALRPPLLGGGAAGLVLEDDTPLAHSNIVRNLLSDFDEDENIPHHSTAQTLRDVGQRSPSIHSGGAALAQFALQPAVAPMMPQTPSIHSGGAAPARVVPQPAVAPVTPQPQSQVAALEGPLPAFDPDSSGGDDLELAHAQYLADMGGIAGITGSLSPIPESRSVSPADPVSPVDSDDEEEGHERRLQAFFAPLPPSSANSELAALLAGIDRLQPVSPLPPMPATPLVPAAGSAAVQTPATPVQSRAAPSSAGPSVVQSGGGSSLVARMGRSLRRAVEFVGPLVSPQKARSPLVRALNAGPSAPPSSPVPVPVPVPVPTSAPAPILASVLGQVPSAAAAGPSAPPSSPVQASALVLGQNPSVVTAAPSVVLRMPEPPRTGASLADRLQYLQRLKVIGAQQSPAPAQYFDPKAPLFKGNVREWRHDWIQYVQANDTP
jgi:hypothetical protein